MTRVFITGSSDGLGLMAGKLLVEQGHKVTRPQRDLRSRRETSAAGSRGGRRRRP
jgi:NAD(P)-dependent dehydrogenase (short-subunit alcohol dehydrogenase family)